MMMMMMMIMLVFISVILVTLVNSQQVYQGLDVIPSTNIDKTPTTTTIPTTTTTTTKDLSNRINNIITNINNRMKAEDNIYTMNSDYYNNINYRINNIIESSSYNIQLIKNKTLDIIKEEQVNLNNHYIYSQNKLLSVFNIIDSSNNKLISIKNNNQLLFDQFTGRISATSLGDVLNKFSVTKNLQEQIVSQANSNVPHEQIASFVKTARPDLTQAHVSDIILATGK